MERNWGNDVITHMADNKEKGMWFPYDGMIKKIMEHVGFNFEGEEPD